MTAIGWDPKWAAWLPKQNQTTSLVVDLVRHGHPRSVVGFQEDGRGYFQGPDDPLTGYGRYQASCLAKHLWRMGYSYRQVLVGTHVRQIQTWEIVQSVVPSGPVKITPLLDERHIPQALWGCAWDDPNPEIQQLEAQRKAEFYSPIQPCEGNENFWMLKARAELALAEIGQYTPGRVLVISSSGLMKMLVAVMIHGSSLGVPEYQRLDQFLTFGYASISTYQCRRKGAVVQWERIVESDYDFILPQ